MRVTIAAVDQRFSLDSGSVTSFLVIQLPSGYTVRATIDDAALEHVVQEARNTDAVQQVAQQVPNQIPLDRVGQFTEVSPLAVQTPVPPPDEDIYPHHVATGEVEWERLPDTQLPPMMKKILRESRIAPKITIEDLDKLKLAISTELSSRPIVGQVAFNSGIQRPVTSIPRRTVPMDEAGNPMPPGGIVDADPGESSDDEDGVAQV